MSKAIGVVINGGAEWHAPGVISDYTTLCGLDADDPEIGHDGTVEAGRGQKITCAECYQIWRDTTALRLRSSSFDIDESQR